MNRAPGSSDEALEIVKRLFAVQVNDQALKAREAVVLFTGDRRAVELEECVDDASVRSFSDMLFNSVLPEQLANAANAEDAFAFHLLQNIALIVYEVASLPDEEDFFFRFSEAIDLSKLDWLERQNCDALMKIIRWGSTARASEKSWAVHAFISQTLSKN